ncbi:hypothetical protein J7L05_08280 [bacterium]|nr:hypothetical protein [bacterium]
MYREIEEKYVDEETGNNQSERIISILSDGIYDYLRLNGYLKSDTTRKNRINKLIKDVRILSSSGIEESGD